MYKLRSKEMSNHVNEIIMEGLADEFFDDVPAAVSWMRKNGASALDVGKVINDENALCEMFVNMSMDMMPDGPQ